MPTYNASSAVNANTTAYAQRLGSKPTFGAPTNSYAVPDVPTPAQLQRKPFNPIYAPPRSNVMPVNDTGFNVQPDNQSTDQGKIFNPGTAFQFTKAAGDSMKMGDGGAHDQTVDMSINKVNGDLQRLGTSENPQAVKQDIENDPWYADNSLWKGIFNAAAATYDGKGVSEAYQAGLKGIQQGEDEKGMSEIKENAIRNRGELLKQYTPDSVADYITTGNPSMLREKKLTQEEIDQRAQAATADQRAYEEKIHSRNRTEAQEDAIAANKADTGKWSAPNKEGYSVNSKTGEVKQVNASASNGNLPTKGSLSTADYYNAVLTNGGKDPYTNEPVKATQLTAAKDWDKGRQAFNSTMTGSDEALKAVNYMLNPDHANDFKSAFGSLDSRLPTTRSGTANMEANLKTIQSQAFLSSIKEMKGMGSLSDAEGQKLVSAIANIDPTLPQKTLQIQLKQIRDHLTKLQEVSQQEAKLKGYINSPVQGALTDAGKSGYDFNNANQWK